MKRMGLAPVAVMCCTVVSPVIAAAPDEAAIKLAKSNYEKGNAAYNLGKFDEAITWFTKAYEAWPVPDFLYNIAQSYRLAGNCRQALFVYKRYLSIKERDKDAPLAKGERAEIERFVKELTECVAKADASAAAQPAELKTTPPSTTTTTSVTTSPAPAATTATPPTTVAATNAPTETTAATGMMITPAPTPRATPAVTMEHGGPDPEVSANTTSNTKILSAYATGGIAMFSGGDDLPIPVQPSFAMGAGYPLSLGPLVLDLGARASFSPIKYDTMSATEQASLVGICAAVGISYRVNNKLSVRGDAGIGVAMLRGLMEGNPFTDTRKAGSFTMPSVRGGVAAEYAITPSLVATIAPLSVGFSSAPDELIIGSLIELDVLVGLGYRL
jgi:hypothetical protein